MDEIKDVLLTPVPNDVVPNVNVFGALGGHVVGGHTYARLVVFVEKNRLVYPNAEFAQERP